MYEKMTNFGLEFLATDTEARLARAVELNILDVVLSVIVYCGDATGIDLVPYALPVLIRNVASFNGIADFILKLLAQVLKAIKLFKVVSIGAVNLEGLLHVGNHSRSQTAPESC
jgi:hypothetical protein